jgi:hypothetical protein
MSYAFVKWKDFDDLYDVKKLNELIKEKNEKHKINSVYKIKDTDSKRYPAILLKIGNFNFIYLFYLVLNFVLKAHMMNVKNS